VAADLRRKLSVDVKLVEGQYGQFSVLVDDEEIFEAGALASLVSSRPSVVCGN